MMVLVTIADEKGVVLDRFWVTHNTDSEDALSNRVRRLVTNHIDVQEFED